MVFVIHLCNALSHNLFQTSSKAKYSNSNCLDKKSIKSIIFLFWSSFDVQMLLLLLWAQQLSLLNKILTQKSIYLHWALTTISLHVDKLECASPKVHSHVDVSHINKKKYVLKVVKTYSQLSTAVQQHFGVDYKNLIFFYGKTCIGNLKDRCTECRKCLTQTGHLQTHLKTQTG